MIQSEGFFVRFWGVRGSIPCPDVDMIEYGGNSTCLEIRADGRLIIIDFGSGIKNLSENLMKTDFKKGPIDADIFVTHTHLDHLIGFAMFTPFFLANSKLRIYGPVMSGGVKLHSVFANEFSYEYWPVRLNELSSNIIFKQLRETTVDLGGGLKVSTKYINHTVATFAFRFDYKGKSIVTYFDTEPFQNLFPERDLDQRTFYDEDAYIAGVLAEKEENGKILKFLKNADIVIHDCQYTEEEYLNGKLNWGHSTYERAIEAGLKANVKKIIAFHHDPSRTDKELRELEAKYKELHKNDNIELIWAKEGLIAAA